MIRIVLDINQFNGMKMDAKAYKILRDRRGSTIFVDMDK
jgi:hypothetical protein